ncbi:MAG: hypothetical protein ACREX3_16380, partial [Gammaproteobacteria bacterium]
VVVLGTWLIQASPRVTRSLQPATAFCIGVFYSIASMFSGSYYDARLAWLFFAVALVTGSVTNSDSIARRVRMPPERVGA